MELLTTSGIAVRPPPRKIPLALGVSAVVHGALVTGLLLLPLRAASLDAPIEVTVDVLADLLSPPEPEPPVAPRPSVVTAPARVERRAPAKVRSPGPPPEPAATAAPVAEPAEAPASMAAEPDAPAGVPVAPATLSRTGGSGTGSTVADAGNKGGTAPGGGEAQRRASTDGYRSALLRTRIHDVFRYPPEARELELAGRVVVAVTIHRDGRLLGAKLVGRCPHAILCADGLRTIRAAAPFPPISAELGPSIVIEVPLTYAFE